MKMKSMVVASMLVTLFAAGRVGADEGAAQKIGYVDMNRALNEVEEGKKAKADLEADGKAKKQKLEIKQGELKTLKAELDKQRLILSADALNKKEAELQGKFMELQKMNADFEQEFSQKEAELTKPIADKLKKIVADLGASGGYAAVLPKEVMLYGLAGNELTDEVIRRYNKK